MSERHVTEKIDHYSTLIKGFLVGSLFGAVVTLLSAPQTGPETSEELRQKGMELRERAMEMTEETRQRAQEMKVRGQMLYADQKSKLESVVAGVQEGARVLVEPETVSDMSTMAREQAITLETTTTDVTPYNSPSNPFTSDPLDEEDSPTQL